MYYFDDPVLFAPLVGCMLMCLTAACIGVFVVLQKEALLGEALSHTAYPGVVMALLVSKCLFSEVNIHEYKDLFIVLTGAFFSCLSGVYCIRYMQRKNVSQDAALACVLSVFFGVGIFLLSILQADYPTLYPEAQALLFGQAATMMNMHVVVYTILSLFTIFLILLFTRPLITKIFDPVFSYTIGYSKHSIEGLLFFLIILATVIGIRSVGVVLLSAMLIFPVATARFFVQRVRTLFILSACIGILAGFLGVVSSHELSRLYVSDQNTFLSFPTGPLIVMWAAGLFSLAACLAPGKGLVMRKVRGMRFIWVCRQENILKSLWKCSNAGCDNSFSQEDVSRLTHERRLPLAFLLLGLTRNGFLRINAEKKYELTAVGMLWGRKIVRLHRLWEVYLVEFCKFPKDRVHLLAEDMEHVLTDEMERELTALLKNPLHDPHQAPIPEIV